MPFILNIITLNIGRSTVPIRSPDNESPIFIIIDGRDSGNGRALAHVPGYIVAFRTEIRYRQALHLLSGLERRDDASGMVNHGHKEECDDRSAERCIPPSIAFGCAQRVDAGKGDRTPDPATVRSRLFTSGIRQTGAGNKARLRERLTFPPSPLCAQASALVLFDEIAAEDADFTSRYREWVAFREAIQAEAERDSRRLEQRQLRHTWRDGMHDGKSTGRQRRCQHVYRPRILRHPVPVDDLLHPACIERPICQRLHWVAVQPPRTWNVRRPGLARACIQKKGRQ